MKVGDYVRTKSYGIKKINGFSSTLEEDFIDCDYDKYQRVLINKKEVVKSSPNIIDLIEVGDVIVGKDNHKFEVYAVGSDCVYINELKEFILVKDIKGIVTKEQFSQMECRIGE